MLEEKKSDNIIYLIEARTNKLSIEAKLLKKKKPDKKVDSNTDKPKIRKKYNNVEGAFAICYKTTFKIKTCI